MLEFRILGPVEVVRDGRALPLGGARQRALVADLTLHANEVISADRLIDDLWGEEPPGTAAHMLHVYVSRLRKVLEDHGRDVLVTRPPGYELRLGPPDELDAARFETRVRRGAEALGSRPAEALEALDEALAWWRGRALEEFADEAFAQPSAARLEGLRQAAHEDRIEALLALGRHDEALADLDGLIARFPLRERLRELQMLALYRSGRQADALQAFQAARRTLAEELGVDPGTGLVSLEQAILRHDPALDAPEREPEPVRPEPALGPPPRSPPPRQRRRWFPVAVVSVAVVAALGVVASFVLGPEPPSGAEDRPSPSADDGVELPITWTEVSDPGGERLGGKGDQVILGGATTPGGLIAVGFTAPRRPSAGEPRDYDAAVWIETGTGPWQPIDDPAFVAPGNQEATDAVAIEDRIVVVGSDGSTGDFDAAVWTLDEGQTAWRRSASTAAGMRKAGDQKIRAVTWTGSRIVGVGYNRRSDGDADAAIWTSTDGLDWTVLTPTNLDVLDDQEMSSVTTFGDLVVAAGFSVTAQGRDAAVWISRGPDGSTWETVDHPALGGEGDQQIATIIAAGPGLLAVGRETIAGGTDAAVWFSTDGVEWQRVEDPGNTLGGEGTQEMSSVVSAGGVIVAAGRGIVGRLTDAAVWTSTDGATWTRDPSSTFSDYGGQAVRALLFVDDVFVALGREGRGGGDDADIWLGQPRG